MREKIAIGHWDGRDYLGDGSGPDARYLCEIQDDRLRRGRVALSLAPESGSTEDVVDIVVEIATVPGKSYSAPHIVIQCGNTIVADLYQTGSDAMQDITKEEVA